MNLTPEQKEAGKRNFWAAITADPLDRRDFMKTGIAAGAVAGGSLGAFYFGYEAAVANPVRVGVLGTGDQGNVLIGAINPQFIQVKAIADSRPYNRYRAFHGDYYSPDALKARPGLLAKYGWPSQEAAERHVNVYEDYQELLSNEPDVEAVIIALPLHLHARAAIAAMRAGKHVLTETLMGHGVRECKEMALAAEETWEGGKTGLYLATGHQRHYNILYQEAADTIQRGVLGDLHYIRAQWHRGNLPGSDSRQKPMPGKTKPEDQLAEELKKELREWEKESKKAMAAGDAKAIFQWQKKLAQKRAQIDDVVLEKKARDFDDRYVPLPGLDAVGIFISAVHGGKRPGPLSVTAMANRPLAVEGDPEVNDHVCCLLEFPAADYDAKDRIASRKRIGVQYASIDGNGYGGYGEIIFGTKRTLILEREQEAMLFHGPSASKIKTSAGGGPTLDTQASGEMQAAAAGPAREVSCGYTEELEHWAWCIRNPARENKPRCDPEVALADAVIALTANMAAERRRRIDFKKEWFDVHDDATPENPKNLASLKPDPARYKS